MRYIVSSFPAAAVPETYGAYQAYLERIRVPGAEEADASEQEWDKGTPRTYLEEVRKEIYEALRRTR
ncbi:hypothetical protein NDU88_011007 [Pleurodeles waltl]|uniref:Uncharacterized protein n=1 Tax=Pleurodeles waltl TaxID=8319 RepID=A0AAV7PXP8_PLEWA|nr:hypothetical protein NDU88_011007 [Pleurodeles waltl]